MAGTISSAGIGSGLDVNKIVTQLIAAERKPADTKLATDEAHVQGKLSALASLKGALSAFQSALARLKDPATFQVRDAQSSDTDLFTASAASTATPGSYAIRVDALAQAQKLSSTGYDPDAAVGTGTLTVSVGDKSLDIVIDASNNTLAGIRDAINHAGDNPGVTATIIHTGDGSHLQIVSNATGIANAATISTADGEAGLAAFVDGLSVTTAAADASITVDGYQYTSAGNTITGVIDGVTLNLAAAGAESEATLTVGLDKSAAAGAVKSFVNSYNSFVGVVKSLSGYNADTGQAGPLLGDSTLLTITSRVRKELGSLTGAAGDPIRGLSDIGVSFQVDGTLAIDDDKLDTALNQHFDAVGSVFASAGGYATTLGGILDSYLDTGGIFDTRTDGLNRDLAEIDAERRNLDRRMAAEQKRYLAQFTALDTLVSQLRSTGDFLTRQFNAMLNTDSQSN